MLNKVLLNSRGNNKIRIVPDCFKEPEELIDTLQTNDKVIRHSYYCNRKRGLLTGVWQLDNKIYLVICIRLADKKSYDTTIIEFDAQTTTASLSNIIDLEKWYRSHSK